MSEKEAEFEEFADRGLFLYIEIMNELLDENPILRAEYIKRQKLKDPELYETTRTAEYQAWLDEPPEVADKQRRDKERTDLLESRTFWLKILAYNKKMLESNIKEKEGWGSEVNPRTAELNFETTQIFKEDIERCHINLKRIEESLKELDKEE